MGAVNIIMKDNSILMCNLIDIGERFVTVKELSSAMLPPKGYKGTLPKMGELVRTFSNMWKTSSINLDEIKSIHYMDEKKVEAGMTRLMESIMGSDTCDKCGTEHIKDTMCPKCY